MIRFMCVMVMDAHGFYSIPSSRQEYCRGLSLSRCCYPTQAIAPNRSACWGCLCGWVRRLVEVDGRASPQPPRALGCAMQCTGTKGPTTTQIVELGVDGASSHTKRKLFNRIGRAGPPSCFVSHLQPKARPTRWGAAQSRVTAPKDPSLFVDRVVDDRAFPRSSFRENSLLQGFAKIPFSDR
jgi:hypothetical protein